MLKCLWDYERHAVSVVPMDDRIITCRTFQIPLSFSVLKQCSVCSQRSFGRSFHCQRNLHGYKRSEWVFAALLCSLASGTGVDKHTHWGPAAVVEQWNEALVG